MKPKKIILIISLIAILILISIGIYFINSNATTSEQTDTQAKTSNNKKNNDYIIVGDNYFIQKTNDILYNTDDYEGKTVEIEGFPMTNGEYKFVARYGPGCCVGDGIAYLEYEYDKELDLVDEKDWIKVVGTIKKGNDGITDYVYIEATSVEKIDTRGQDTVAN